MHPVNTLKASRWNSIIMPHRGPCTPLYFPPCEPRRIVGQLVMASSLRGLILLGIFRGELDKLDDPRPLGIHSCSAPKPCWGSHANQESRVFSVLPLPLSILFQRDSSTIATELRRRKLGRGGGRIEFLNNGTTPPPLFEIFPRANGRNITSREIIERTRTRLQPRSSRYPSVNPGNDRYN